MNKRFMIYLHNSDSKYSPANYNEILFRIRKNLESLPKVEARDVRISNYFIEIDLSIYAFDEKIKDNVLVKLGDVGNCLLVDEITDSKTFMLKDYAINVAIFLFNTERYWKSHEVLEDIWKKSEGTEKRILNGLILIDAAFVHYQKHEFDIFLSILNRSLEKFHGFRGIFHSIMVDELVDNINKIITLKKFIPFKIRII